MSITLDPGWINETRPWRDCDKAERVAILKIFRSTKLSEEETLAKLQRLARVYGDLALQYLRAPKRSLFGTTKNPGPVFHLCRSATQLRTAIEELGEYGKSVAAHRLEVHGISIDAFNDWVEASKAIGAKADLLMQRPRDRTRNTPEFIGAFLLHDEWSRISDNRPARKVVDDVQCGEFLLICQRIFDPVRCRLRLPDVKWTNITRRVIKLHARPGDGDAISKTLS